MLDMMKYDYVQAFAKIQIAIPAKFNDELWRKKGVVVGMKHAFLRFSIAPWQCS